MTEKLSDSEVVGLFRELESMDRQAVDAEARVNAAYKEWSRQSREYQELNGRRFALSERLTAVTGASDFGPRLTPNKKASPAAELTQREHEVWIMAYNGAYGGLFGLLLPSDGPSQAEVATKTAREAVEAYRKVVSGTTDG